MMERGRSFADYRTVSKINETMHSLFTRSEDGDVEGFVLDALLLRRELKCRYFVLLECKVYR